MDETKVDFPAAGELLEEQKHLCRTGADVGVGCAQTAITLA